MSEKVILSEKLEDNKAAAKWGIKNLDYLADVLMMQTGLYII